MALQSPRPSLSPKPYFENASKIGRFGVQVYGFLQEFVSPVGEMDFSITFDARGNVTNWGGGCLCGGMLDPSTGPYVDGRPDAAVVSYGLGKWTKLVDGVPAPVPLPASLPLLVAAGGVLGLLKRRQA